MNNRFLALIALGAFATGCAQLGTPPAGQAIPEPSPVANTEAPQPEPATVKVAIADTSAGDLATVLLDPAAETASDDTSDNTIDTGNVAQPSATTDAGIPVETGVKPPELEAAAAETAPVLVQTDEERQRVKALCNEIGNKLGSVSVDDCLAQPLTFAGGYTVQSRPMVVRDFHTESRLDKETRILILGGIHGDEYSSISIMFKWMELLDASDNRDFRWRFVPTVNPDGLLDGQAVRQNANGVDLNRNFPSADWLDLAEDYWKDNTKSNPRRYPGSHPASEPEVQWVVDQIQSFKPDVIVSVHAPYHLLDYDGPPEPPEKIGELRLHLLGVYPGSLGNYAGINLGIPVVTMELPSAGIMPSDDQITSMWIDLLEWLYEHHET